MAPSSSSRVTSACVHRASSHGTGSAAHEQKRNGEDHEQERAAHGADHRPARPDSNQRTSPTWSQRVDGRAISTMARAGSRGTAGAAGPSGKRIRRPGRPSSSRRSTRCGSARDRRRGASPTRLRARVMSTLCRLWGEVTARAAESFRLARPPPRASKRHSLGDEALVAERLACNEEMWVRLPPSPSTPP